MTADTSEMVAALRRQADATHRLASWLEDYPDMAAKFHPYPQSPGVWAARYGDGPIEFGDGPYRALLQEVRATMPADIRCISDIRLGRYETVWQFSDLVRLTVTGPIAAGGWAGDVMDQEYRQATRDWCAYTLGDNDESRRDRPVMPTEAGDRL